jgi:hypothetical protein
MHPDTQDVDRPLVGHLPPAAATEVLVAAALAATL